MLPFLKKQEKILSVWLSLSRTHRIGFQKNMSSIPNTICFGMFSRSESKKCKSHAPTALQKCAKQSTFQPTKKKQPFLAWSWTGGPSKLWKVVGVQQTFQSTFPFALGSHSASTVPNKEGLNQFGVGNKNLQVGGDGTRKGERWDLCHHFLHASLNPIICKTQASCLDLLGYWGGFDFTCIYMYTCIHIYIYIYTSLYTYWLKPELNQPIPLDPMLTSVSEISLDRRLMSLRQGVQRIWSEKMKFVCVDFFDLIISSKQHQCKGNSSLCDFLGVMKSVEGVANPFKHELQLWMDWYLHHILKIRGPTSTRLQDQFPSKWTDSFGGEQRYQGSSDLGIFSIWLSGKLCHQVISMVISKSHHFIIS